LTGRKGQPPKRRHIPLLGLARAGKGGYFDDSGCPAGSGWDEIDVPGVTDQNAYALEITGDSMMPVYREGDTIIVSPSASIRKGDRVVVRRDGQVMQDHAAPDRKTSSWPRSTPTTHQGPRHERRRLDRRMGGQASSAFATRIAAAAI
jgi:hypothetical protein